MDAPASTLPVANAADAANTFHNAVRFRRKALGQAVALMLLAVLPALGSWIKYRYIEPFAFHRAVPPAAPKRDNAPLPTTAPSAVPTDGMVNLDQATAWGDQVLWVDARRRVDYDRAHVPGALLLNEDEWNALFPAVVEVWNPQRRVVVYCDGGACQASRQVAARLRDDGVEGALVLRGGWPEWVKRFGKPKP